MSRCPKSDAAANNGYIEDLYKVSADFEMKLTAAHAEIAELRAAMQNARTQLMATGHAEDCIVCALRLIDDAITKSANPGGAHEVRA